MITFRLTHVEFYRCLENLVAIVGIKAFHFKFNVFKTLGIILIRSLLAMSRFKIKSFVIIFVNYTIFFLDVVVETLLLMKI